MEKPNARRNEKHMSVVPLPKFLSPSFFINLRRVLGLQCTLGYITEPTKYKYILNQHELVTDFPFSSISLL